MWLGFSILYMLYAFFQYQCTVLTIPGHRKGKCFQTCVFCVFQGEKECLNSETTELKQKIRYLQDQLLPLSKQREYQEKEIQRLNRVSVENLWNKE